jgi:CspA family cold shock protein
MALGTFKWFDVESGYGLISPDDGERNLFVHSTDIASASELEALEAGTRVSYEVHQSRNGPRARKIFKEQIRYSWRDDCLERHEGKEARNQYYARLDYV